MKEPPINSSPEDIMKRVPKCGSWREQERERVRKVGGRERDGWVLCIGYNYTPKVRWLSDLFNQVLKARGK